MNVFWIVRSRLPFSVDPCPLASDINSLTLIKAFSTRPYSTVVALKFVPWAMLLPLRGSWEPEVKRRVEILTELNILFTRFVISSTSLGEIVVFSITPWANPKSSLAFSNTSLVDSCSGSSRTAACNCSADNFSDSFLSEIVLSASLSSEVDLLSLISVLFSVAFSWTLLDSLVAFDKTVKSLSKRESSSSTSFCVAVSLSSRACPFWTLSLIGEITDLSRSDFDERVVFNSSTTFFNFALSTTLTTLSLLVVIFFSEGFCATSTLLSVDCWISTSGLSFSFWLTTSVVGCEWFSITLSALATRAPKNISAATATEAAPKLYLRIEKRRTFSRWWRFILLSEFDLFSIVPPYVMLKHKIK